MREHASDFLLSPNRVNCRLSLRRKTMLPGLALAFAGEAFPPLCVAIGSEQSAGTPPDAKKPKSEGAAASVSAPKGGSSLVFAWTNKGCDCPRCEKPPASV